MDPGSRLQSSTGVQVLLDIGANQGNWTAEALRLVEPAGRIRVHAFEPSLATRTILTNRFAASPAVSVEPYAVSDSQGEATFYTIEDGAGTNSLSPSSGPHAELTRVVTIDAFLDQSNIASVLMAKIDTEGFDFLVLKGAGRALRDGRLGIVQFEYNWRWLLNHVCLRDVFELIAHRPYQLGKLVGSGLELYDTWHAELDRFSRPTTCCSGRTTLCVHSELTFTSNRIERRDTRVARRASVRRVPPFSLPSRHQPHARRPVAPPSNLEAC